ncbi:MAG: hypothetical protein IKB47_04490 [Clostridia bacterium]|nr:hypothetical protein [Clostridia bacterium]
MSNKKPTSKKQLWIRILCAILAFLMIASVAYLAIELILDEINRKPTIRIESAETTMI